MLRSNRKEARKNAMDKIEKSEKAEKLKNESLYLHPDSPAFTAGTPKGEIVSIHTG